MNWLLQNFGKRARFALANPLYTLNSLFHELALADERFLGSITSAPFRQIRGFLKEPFQVLLQYAVVRAFQPKIIVETGVANGVSSAYILLALHANGGGTLYSIGLNDPEYLPAEKPLGWVVPQEFRSKREASR